MVREESGVGEEVSGALGPDETLRGPELAPRRVAGTQPYEAHIHYAFSKVFLTAGPFWELFGEQK